MFDFNYNENVGFVPYVSVVREKAGKSSEEIAETKKAVKDLSKTVATQSESVAENSAAIADNTSAIASNTSAIADETAAREAAVEELNEKISEVPKFKIEVVDSLPAEGDSATIYLLKVSEEAGNLYEEYVYSNGAWEKLGPMVDLSGYATKDEMEAAFAGVYTKDEVDALIAPLAVQADVDAALALKADADAVYTKDEVDAAIAPLAVKDEVDAALDEKANSSDVYTKDEADAKFLTEHQDISGLATKDELSDAVEPLAVKADVEDALALKADADSVYTKDEADAKFLTEHQDISGLASKTELEEAVAPLAVKADVDAALDEKADADAVYTKEEADAKFLTEHQDISALATKTELEEAVAPLAVKSAVDEAINQEADERAQGDAAAVAAIGAVTTALDAEVTAREEALQAVEAKDAEQDAEIAKKVEWVESVPGRNHIVLKNHDNILGTAQDGTTYNLAMVSKWDVADFGTSSLHTNLNSLDGVVTINDNKQIATVDQIPVVDDFATKAEVEEAVSAETVARMAAIAELHEEIVALPKFKILIVDELPAVGDTATFYLLATGDEQGNVYTEYVYVNGAWEEIGTQSLDLSEYAKTADVDAAFATVNDNMDTLSGVVETLTYEFESVDEKLAGLAEANAEQDAEIALRATKAELEAVDAKVDAIVIPDLTPYALAADVTSEIAAATGVLAAKDAEQDEAINEINSGLTELADVKANAADVDEALAAKVNAVDYNKLLADFEAVKKVVGGMGGSIVWSANTKAEVTDLLGNGGGTVNLMFDITEDDGMFQYTTPTFGSPTKTFNLRNHDIITSGRNNACMFLLRSDQELTITGGNITNTNTSGSSPDESTLRNPVFIAKGDSTLNLSLGSTKTATTLSMDPVVVCQENATINIKSGNYITSDVCLIYCMNGLINITGGSFRSTANPAGYLINCLDAPYQAGTANIVISSTSKTSGPKFYDFNPADCGSEGEHTNFVAEGCEVKVTTETIDEVEHTVYTVVKSA